MDLRKKQRLDYSALHSGEPATSTRVQQQKKEKWSTSTLFELEVIEVSFILMTSVSAVMAVQRRLASYQGYYNTTNVETHLRFLKELICVETPKYKITGSPVSTLGEMNGTLGNLSNKQQEKLNQLRINLEDVLLETHDDHMLLRFLRARNFNLKSTEVLLRKDVKWKNQMQTSSLSTDDSPEVLRKYWPGGCCGFAKDGSPVWIDPIGKCDIRGLLYSSKASDVFKHNIAIVESLYHLMQQQSQKCASHVEGIIYIADMEGFGLHHLWKPGVDVVNRNAALFEQHYPETLKKIFVINAPTIFPIAYSLVKPFLQENTRMKVNVLGSNWKEILLKHIDAAEIPLHWGGTATGHAGDPYCSHQVMPAGKVPESYYMKDRDLSRLEMIKYELSRGSSLELKYDVHKPGSVLRYEFQTKKNDLAFGIKRIAEDGCKIDVLPIQRYNCHMVWEDGEISLQLPGQYVVIFDNSYSWTKSKKMLYWVELLEPADDDPEKEPTLQEAVSDNLQGMEIFE